MLFQSEFEHWRQCSFVISNISGVRKEIYLILRRFKVIQVVVAYSRYLGMLRNQKKGLQFFKLTLFGSLSLGIVLLFQNCGAIHLSAVSTPAAETQLPSPAPSACAPNEPCGNEPAQIPAGFQNDSGGVFVQDWGDITYKTHRCTQFDHCFFSQEPSASFFSPAGEHLNVGGMPNTVYSVKIETPQLGAPVLDQNGNPETLTDYNGNKFAVIYNPRGYSVRIDTGDTVIDPMLNAEDNISFSALPFDMGYSIQPTGVVGIVDGPSNLSSNVPKSCNTTSQLKQFAIYSDASLAPKGTTAPCVLAPGKTYFMNIAITPGKTVTKPGQLYGTLWDMYTDSICLCVNPSDYTTCHTMGAGTSCAP